MGELHKCPVFQQRKEEQVEHGADPIWLARHAKQLRAELIRRLIEQSIDEISRAVYIATTDPKEGEVARGWAIGPMTEEAVTKLTGDPLWIASRRSGVKLDPKEKIVEDCKKHIVDKIRQIDDLSEYFVNACTTHFDKVGIAGIDAIAGLAQFWADKVLQARRSNDWSFTIWPTAQSTSTCCTRNLGKATKDLGSLGNAGILKLHTSSAVLSRCITDTACSL